MTILTHCDAPDCDATTEVAWINEYGDGDCDGVFDGWHHFGHGVSCGDWCPTHFPAEVRWYGPDELITMSDGTSGFLAPDWLMDALATRLRSGLPTTPDTTPTPATDPATAHTEAS